MNKFKVGENVLVKYINNDKFTGTISSLSTDIDGEETHYNVYLNSFSKEICFSECDISHVDKVVSGIDNSNSNSGTLKVREGKLDYLEKYPNVEQCIIITTQYDLVLDFIAVQEQSPQYIRFSDIFLCDFQMLCKNGDRIISNWGEPTDTQGHSHDLCVVVHKTDEIPF